MTYKISENGNISTVFLDGEIDMDVTEKAKEIIFPLVEAGKEVHVNLKDVSYMDSSGISVLIESHQKAIEKGTKVIVKEIRFGPNTDEHDYEFKKKHGIKFLKEGAKLKAFVFFKGRSIIFKEKGQILLLKLAQELEEYGKVESLPTMEGKKMIMFVAPKK